MKNNKIRLTIVANKAFIHKDRIRYWNTINDIIKRKESIKLYIHLWLV